MILRIFRTNQPAVLLGLPLVALVLWAFLWFFPGDTTFPSPELIHNSISTWPSWLLLLTEATLITLEAMLFNRILNELEIFDRVSFLPSVVFVFCAFILIPGGEFRLEHLSNWVVLQSAHTVLVTYREHTSKSETFLAGFFLGLGILVNPYLAPLFLFIWLALNVLKAFRWREWMLVLLGMAVPLYFFMMIYFAATGHWFAFQMPEWTSFRWNWQVFGTDNTSKLFAILFGVFLLFALFSWLGRMRGNIMRVRKQRLVLLYLNLFLIAAGVFLSGYFAQGGLYLLLIPVSLLSAFMLAHSNFKWLLELYFYGLLILFVLAKAFPVV